MAKSSDQPNFQNIALRLGTVFVPSSPIDSEDLFCGRNAQIRDVVDAINQKGRHAILYGERGVGKTSLGKILQTKLKAIEPVPITSPLITCDSSDNYSSIWNKAFEAIGIDGYGVEEKSDESTGEMISILESPDVMPHDVRKRLDEAGRDGILYVIIDEFEKIADETSRKLIADTIKLLSDHATPATIVVIGVAEDVTGLIKDHSSIERCLAQVPMPRMPREELEQIVKKGLKSVGMTADQDALLEISGLSKGLPHYTHMLALNAARSALDRSMLNVTSDDVESAVKCAIRQGQESIRTDYDKATYSTRKETLYEAVLLACSMAETDEFGRFQPANVVEPLRKITGTKFSTDRFGTHLKVFCDEDRGPVLVRTGGEYRWKYRFKTPLMQPFVMMKGLAAGQISKDDLHLMQDANGQKRMPFTGPHDSSVPPQPS